MKLQLDCKDMSRLLSDAQDTELNPALRTRMRLHLVICRTCRSVEEQIDFIRRAMRRLALQEPAPDGQPPDKAG